jgi:hypothetical protein
MASHITESHGYISNPVTKASLILSPVNPTLSFIFALHTLTLEPQMWTNAFVERENCY